MHGVSGRPEIDGRLQKNLLATSRSNRPSIFVIALHFVIADVPGLRMYDSVRRVKLMRAVCATCDELRVRVTRRRRDIVLVFAQNM